MLSSKTFTYLKSSIFSRLSFATNIDWNIDSVRCGSKIRNGFRINAFLYMFLMLLLLPSTSFGTDYPDRPEVQEFITLMNTKHDYDPKILQAMFNEAEYKQSIIDAITRPAEKRLEWWEYRNIFLKKKRIKAGVEFWQKNSALINKIAKTYKVDPHIIIAILGVETYYGRLQGKYRVVDSLITLGFDYERRAKFFRSQLEEFLLLAREEQLKPSSFIGSYAGAMGYGQFIPSSYRAYAVDFDKDGYRDIWKNIADATGSVANYMKKHKWKYKKAVVSKVKVSGDAFEDYVNSGLKAKTKVQKMKSLGVKTTLKNKELVGLIRLQEKENPAYWLAQHNFYVITKYNRSRMYAMAVHDLSQAILVAKDKNK